MLIHILLCWLVTVNADIYLHNPRGSNNRLDEQGRERNNANRLFDSQNNNRGGYNVGSVYYYAGSQLRIEWTNQHSCNSENNHCEIIIQYMCGAHIRDGVTTTTIPENLMDCDNYDCNTDKRYGMHEDYDHYLECKMRRRNRGLFIADQNVGSSAKNTRQNPKGIRRGYECPEERDYYPYWHNSPWKDIVILTNNATRCPYYQSESQNVKSRWHCVLPRNFMYQHMNDHNLKLPNNEEDCKKFRYPANSANGIQGHWLEIPTHGVPAPDCMETPYTRDNHLGNGLGGYPPTYDWTIPDLEEENCVLRIRYNISTNDYNAWHDVDAANNKQSKMPYSNLDLSPLVGLPNKEVAIQRGYTFKNNPQVKLFDGLDLEWKLAINTAQFGRTFQDRSHTFAIRRRPESLTGVMIHNLNVRGKRGNIVQVYPAVEYDFFPNTLTTKVGDYIHIQWTGSNTNPPNNDGQGLQRTDRTNLLVQASQTYPEGTGYAYIDTKKYGHWGRSYPEMLDNATFLGLSRDDLVRLAILNPHFGGEMSELDDAGTYFDLGLRRITMTGIFHYLCTRNNNFSNRSQKGRIIVNDFDMTQKSIGWNGGSITLSDGKTSLVVPQGTFAQLYNIRIEQWNEERAKRMFKKLDKVPPSDHLAASVIVVHPEHDLAVAGKTFQLSLPYKASLLKEVIVYRSMTHSITWQRVDVTNKDSSILMMDVTAGGIYIIVKHAKVGAITGIVVTVLVFIAAIIITLIYVIRKSSRPR